MSGAGFFDFCYVIGYNKGKRKDIERERKYRDERLRKYEKFGNYTRIHPHR